MLDVRAQGKHLRTDNPPAFDYNSNSVSVICSGAASPQATEEPVVPTAEPTAAATPETPAGEAVVGSMLYVFEHVELDKIVAFGTYLRPLAPPRVRS